MLDDSLLDDVAALQNTDAGGYLRSAAMAGAQVRATLETAAEGGELAALGDGRPRALVLLTRPGVGAASAAVLAGLLGPSCPVPIVLSENVPSWIGALDVVVAHTDDPGDSLLATGIETAARRGARVVLTAPDEGPVAAAVAGAGLLIRPRVPVPPGLGFPRALTGGLIVTTALGLLDIDIEALADEVDRESERCHPVHESFVNPAKSLALRMADRVPLLWGLDPVATAVAQHGADTLGRFAGVVADAAGYPQAITRTALHNAALRAGSGPDLFADPDEPADGKLLPRVMLLAVRRGRLPEATQRAAEDTLPSADLVTPVEETVTDDAVSAAVLALRFDLAALYLGLASGTLSGPAGYTQSVV